MTEDNSHKVVVNILEEVPKLIGENEILLIQDIRREKLEISNNQYIKRIIFKFMEEIKQLIINNNAKLENIDFYGIYKYYENTMIYINDIFIENCKNLKNIIWHSSVTLYNAYKNIEIKGIN